MPALSKLELCALLPHGESMCLLHAVDSWDSSGIVCVAISHCDPENPLRRLDRLNSICGLEYAAQAMAVHVGLTSPLQDVSSAIGYLGGMRDIEFQAPRLDLFTSPMNIQANLLIGQGTNFMYSFHITSEGTPLLSGRASIFIQLPTEPL